MPADAPAAWLLPSGLILAALAGLAAGSAIATLAIRWPEGRGLGGRSACDSCGAQLGATDLVPLVSFLALGGRCRHCGAAIDLRHPLIEATAALLAMLAWAAAPGPLGAAGALLAWMLLAMATLDVEHLWLPDRLTIPFLILGLLLGLGSLPDRMAGAAVGGGLLVLLRAGFARLAGREGLGLGDAKLAAGLGAWLSWSSLPPLLLLASLIGFGVAIMRCVETRRALGTGSTMAAGRPIPFGACLAAAALPLWLTRAGGLW